jgi:hypothetical protein
MKSLRSSDSVWSAVTGFLLLPALLFAEHGLADRSYLR